MARSTLARPLAMAAVLAVTLSGCVSNAPKNESAGGATSGSPSALTVDSTDTECKLSATTAPSGNLSFAVTNTGDKVTEFYVLYEDGLRIAAEAENIGPGLTRDLVLRAAPGTYVTACKPGIIGSGIRAQFTVTDSGVDLTPTGADAELVATANASYASYVKDQTEQLLEKTTEFVTLWKAGKTAEAKAAYADARVHWERIEPVAESFGDLDPRMDLREADLEPKQAWTGWHVAEKDLWPPATGYTALTTAQRAKLGDQLVADTKDLFTRTRTTTYSLTQIGNGAKSLLDEVATGKVTGEEETWSHTDLWDFQANVDGARVAWQGLRPILKKRNAALDTTLEQKFAALQTLLDAQRVGDGFTYYDKLTKPQIKALSDAVNALSEPLSKLTAAVL